MFQQAAFQKISLLYSIAMYLCDKRLISRLSANNASLAIIRLGLLQFLYFDPSQRVQYKYIITRLTAVICLLVRLVRKWESFKIAKATSRRSIIAVYSTKLTLSQYNSICCLVASLGFLISSSNSSRVSIKLLLHRLNFLAILLIYILCKRVIVLLDQSLIICITRNYLTYP